MSTTEPNSSSRRRGASVTAATVALTPAAIEQRAFEKFAARGFVHGYDFDDWVQAERELLGELTPKSASTPAAKRATTKTATTKTATSKTTSSKTTSSNKSTAKPAAKKPTSKKPAAKKGGSASGRSTTRRSKQQD